MADQKKNKKYGRNKKSPAMMKYAQSNRCKRNKERNVNTAERRAEAHRRKLEAWGIRNGADPALGHIREQVRNIRYYA